MRRDVNEAVGDVPFAVGAPARACGREERARITALTPGDESNVPDGPRSVTAPDQPANLTWGVDDAASVDALFGEEELFDCGSNEYDIVYDEGLSTPLSDDEIQAACDKVLAYEQVSRPCMVSISVVSEEKIREVNAEWRGVDAATDVVSLECEGPDDPDLAPGEPCELGDIVLAPAFIERQAERFGTTFADEFRLLLVHGMLHLLGYDHLTDEDATAMEALEEAVLAELPGDGTIGHVVLTRHREVDEA